MKRVLPFLLLSPALAHAATLTVTSLADDGSAGTLRAQVAAAAAGDTIEFDASLAGGTIALATASGAIEIDKSLSIVGPEEGPVTLDGLGGAGGTRAYSGGSRTIGLLHASDPDATLTLKNLVFTGAKAKYNASAPDVGPAVSVVGSAVIDNCFWTNNAVAMEGAFNDTTADGGGCLRVAGNLSLANSRFIDNGANGCNYSIGGLLCVRSGAVGITNCVFSGSYGWDGSTQGGNVRGGGAIGIGNDVKDFSMSGCLVEKCVGGSGPGGILINRGCADATFRFTDCAFRDIWGVNANWRHGGAVVYDGGNVVTLLFENVEFSRVHYAGWGGVVRVTGGNSRVVFANCTFSGNYGVEWGCCTDTRCLTSYVNCTAVGNVNGHANANGGTFFCIDRAHHLLNTACVWNHSGKGATRNDTSRYGSTLGVYNSYNHSAGNGASATDNAMDYDADTAFFAEPFETISSLPAWTGRETLSADIAVPVLAVDAKGERKDPALRRVVEIKSKKDGGVLDQAGWPVKHSEDWSSIAYTKDGGATWTALVGNVADATILVTADSRGVAYPMSSSTGLPKCPIGSAAVLADSPTMVLVF